MERSAVRQLDVFWGQVLVGRYRHCANGADSFEYDSGYLASSDATPISHSLPLRAGSYGRKQLRPFFAGLLPEEAQRQKIASYLGLAASDDFSMLEAIGGECAGALSIIPHGAALENGSGRLVPCDEEKLAEIIRMLPYRPMLAGEKGLRLSLAGAQSKLPVVFSDGRFFLPENGAPSTHILKPELSEWFSGIVYNEHCCMVLAKMVGVPAAETQIIVIGGKPCLVVTRYDRATDVKSNVIRRIHQEDFCQALGRPPEQKYQTEGGPLARDIVRLLRSGWSTRPAKDVLAFVDLVIYNAIIGNADAHGKNYSMLYDGTDRRLSPGYDLVSTVCWPALSTTPAMKIGGSNSINSVLGGHWRKFAEEVNVSPAAIRARVEELCSAVTATSCDTLSLPSLCTTTLNTIQQRATKILALL